MSWGEEEKWETACGRDDFEAQALRLHSLYARDKDFQPYFEIPTQSLEDVQE